MNNKIIRIVAFIAISCGFVWPLAACRGNSDEVIVTRVVTSVAQEIVAEPTTVIVKEVTATPEPTAVPTETPSATSTPDLPLATNPIELVGHEDLINSIRFSPDSRLILASSDDGTARIWDLDGNLRLTLTGHTDRVADAVFSPDGKLIVTSSDDETARIWAVGGELLHVLEGHSSRVNSALFTPDGRFIITNAREPKIWDTEGNLLSTLEGHLSLQVNSWVSPNGRYLISTSGDASAILWQIDEEGKATVLMDLSEVATDGRPLKHAFFLPQSEVFITDSLHLITWGITSNGEVLELGRLGIAADIFDIAFANDNLIFVENFSFGLGAIRRSDNPSGPILLEGHTSAIVGAVISPNYSYVITGSNDHTVRLWDMQGETLLVFEGSELPVRYALISPDENFVVTGDRDDFLQLWDISSLAER